ncbi:MAG TPA: rhodanese-like domain-containing protein, partial [Flavobacteriales bacterium]|nr:rhodanese-like domain-containing protein [Flavobacteriales bacterium]
DAKFIGYDSLNFKAIESLQKDEEIIVYCSVGYRSEIVCEKLSELGFTNVSNLYGGLFEWVNQSKPIVDGEGNITNRVHAFDKTWGIWLNKGEKVY